MKIHELFEARRNPDHPSQQRISTYDQIKNYAATGTGKYFVTFTQLPKVGINPKSIHSETPNAVYAYPLYSSIIKNQLKNDEPLEYIFPYANDAKFANILIAQKPIMDVSNYTEADFEKDIRKMNVSKDEIIQKYGKDLAYAEHPFEKLWIVTYDKNTNKWTKNLLNIGHNGFSDIKGLGLIYKAEPVQALFLRPDAYNVIDMFKNDSEGRVK